MNRMRSDVGINVEPKRCCNACARGAVEEQWFVSMMWRLRPLEVAAGLVAASVHDPVVKVVRT